MKKHPILIEFRSKINLLTAYNVVKNLQLCVEKL